MLTTRKTVRGRVYASANKVLSLPANGRTSAAASRAWRSTWRVQGHGGTWWWTSRLLPAGFRSLMAAESAVLPQTSAEGATMPCESRLRLPEKPGLSHGAGG
jgi:hypothetical protein